MHQQLRIPPSFSAINYAFLRKTMLYKFIIHQMIIAPFIVPSAASLIVFIARDSRLILLPFWKSWFWMCSTKRGEILVVIPAKLNKNTNFIPLEECHLMEPEVNEKLFGKTTKQLRCYSGKESTALSKGYNVCQVLN